MKTTMDTIELTSIMEALCKKTLFLGVLASDQLPKNLCYGLPACVIINTHDSTQPGEHWLAAYINDSDHVCFFDSFGHSPDSLLFPPTIYAFLKKAGTRVLFSNMQVQDYTSITCGEHCVFFLYHMLRGLNFEDTMLKYSDCLIKNDHMVSLFVKKLQRRKHSCNELTCIQHAQPLTRYLYKC